jgi:hypothetical protein
MGRASGCGWFVHYSWFGSGCRRRFIVETLVTGAAVGVSTIAGAAALSQLAIAFHRSGIADEKILTLHQAIQDGKYVLMLRGTELEVAQWREIFKLSNPLNIDDFPYAQITDKD